MFRDSTPNDLHAELERRCARVQKQRHAVLFKRGQSPFGMFLVLSGTVTLDFGVDGANPLNGAYGPGALVGLPASLTGRTYSMTATVTDDAELGFLSIEELKSLLKERPQLCRQLLDILGAKISQTYQIRKGHPEPNDMGVA